MRAVLVVLVPGPENVLRVPVQGRFSVQANVWRPTQHAMYFRGWVYVSRNLFAFPVHLPSRVSVIQRLREVADEDLWSGGRFS